ncbi:MAG: hypothetical protein AAFX44_15960 [Pseudomonadota bacterium]
MPIEFMFHSSDPRASLDTSLPTLWLRPWPDWIEFAIYAYVGPLLIAFTVTAILVRLMCQRWPRRLPGIALFFIVPPLLWTVLVMTDPGQKGLTNLLELVAIGFVAGAVLGVGRLLRPRWPNTAASLWVVCFFVMSVYVAVPRKPPPYFSYYGTPPILPHDRDRSRFPTGQRETPVRVMDDGVVSPEQIRPH